MTVTICSGRRCSMIKSPMLVSPLCWVSRTSCLISSQNWGTVWLKKVSNLSKISLPESNCANSPRSYFSICSPAASAEPWCTLQMWGSLRLAKSPQSSSFGRPCCVSVRPWMSIAGPRQTFRAANKSRTFLFFATNSPLKLIKWMRKSSRVYWAQKTFDGTFLVPAPDWPGPATAPEKVLKVSFLTQWKLISFTDICASIRYLVQILPVQLLAQKAQTIWWQCWPDPALLSSASCFFNVLIPKIMGSYNKRTTLWVWQGWLQNLADESLSSSSRTESLAFRYKTTLAIIWTAIITQDKHIASWLLAVDGKSRLSRPCRREVQRYNAHDFESKISNTERFRLGTPCCSIILHLTVTVYRTLQDVISNHTKVSKAKM